MSGWRIYLFVEFCIVVPPQNLTVSPPTYFPEGPFSANCEIMRLVIFGWEDIWFIDFINVVMEKVGQVIEDYSFL